MAKKPDLRARLEQIARGESSTPKAGVIEPGLVATHQQAFNAWARFAGHGSGEPLAAPAELLTPLP